MLDAAAAVELRVENISRDDCRKLEEALSALFKWRAQQPAQDDELQAQPMSGSLRLDVGKLISNGVLEWMDTLRPAQPLPTDHELQEEPRYDRCDTGELLAPPVVDTTLLLPGGAGAAKRRLAAQAAVGDWTESADNPLSKRRRVGLNKCHNCGSYKHGVKECPAKFDGRRVQASMAEARAERGPAINPIAQMRLRYFDMPAGADGSQKGAVRPPPGVISAELAEALGMPSSTAPPPWLSRMAVLGVPPRYAEQNEQQEGEAADGDGEQLMVFYRGSEDEAEEGEGEAADSPDAVSGEDTAAEAAGAANGLRAAAAAAADVGDDGGGAGVNGAAGSSSSSDGDGDDFIPFAGDSEAAAGQQQEVQQELPPLQSQEEVEANQHRPAEQEQQQKREANGAAHPKQPKWAFPGVNAAVPDDCTDKDGWTAALQTAAWLQTRLA